jgi:glycosyltransferase involved in cell wall biosynthesis
MNKRNRICIVRNKPYASLVPNKRNAAALVAAGYEVDIVCMRAPGEESKGTVAGTTVYRLPLKNHRGGVFRYVLEYSAFFFMAFFKVSWLYLRRRYKIVEVSGIPDFLVYTAIVPRLLGASVVLNFFDHTPDYFQEKYSLDPHDFRVKFLRFLERTSARWAHHVFTTQVVTRDLLASRGVPMARMSVIPNVPDETVFYRTGEKRSDDGKFRLITHGSLLEIYGIETLIKAVPVLVKDIPQLEVKIVGDGEYRPQLERLVQSIGVAKYVVFTGMVPQAKVPGHIAQADIGIVAVHCKFPALSNKLFEYLAMGKPAVVTSISANVAHFDANSVMFFEPDNEQGLARCVLELYRNPEKRAALAEGGLAAYQKYRWSVTKAEYLKVFERLTQ